ncbi:hypothetical protein ACFWD7_01635 [Streptomyces mirabilis]
MSRQERPTELATMAARPSNSIERTPTGIHDHFRRLPVGSAVDITM